MSIHSYLREKVVLLSPQDADDWMEKQDPIERTIKARVNWKNQRVLNAEGEEVISKVNIDIAYDGSIYFDHKFRINNVEHIILSIDRVQDFSSKYLKVFLS